MATTWNPADLVSMTLTGGNLVTNNVASTVGGARSVFSATTGKYYFEALITTATPVVAFGIANAAANLGSAYTTVANVAYVFSDAVGHCYVNSGSTVGNLGGSIGSGSTVAVAVDIGGRLIWFKGVSSPVTNWNGSAGNNPATGTGGFSFSGITGAIYAVGLDGVNSGSTTITANFGDSAFIGAVPAGFIAGFPGVALMPAPVLDRHGNSSSSGGTTTTISVTTGAANTLVLLMATIGGTSTTVVPALSISGAGLTWHAIDVAGAASGPMAGGFQTAVQMWWAIAAAQLTAQVVTVTSNQTIDDASTVYASFTGAYAAAPLDPNAGAIVASVHNTTIIAPSGVLSSTNPNDIAIVAQGANQPNTASASAPVSVIDFNLNGGGARYSMGALALQTFTTPQTNVTVGYTNTSQYWGFIGAMLTADASVVAGGAAQARAMVLA